MLELAEVLPVASDLSERKHVTPKAAILVFLLACGANTFAQGKPGKIIFYRESDFLESDFKPLVYCDGFELARIRSRSYVEVVAQPGRHSCVAESAQDPETIVEIVPGGTAYQRIVITPTLKRHAVLTASNEEDFKKRKNLTRIATAELDSVQPLVPAEPAPLPTPANTMDSGSATKAVELERVFQSGMEGILPPHCEYCPSPRYTAKARQAKIEGTVIMFAIIGADGRAHNIEIVKALGQGMDEEAVNVLKTWRFKPAVGPDGTPVAIIVPIEMRFSLLK